jgi:hypothetical protein
VSERCQIRLRLPAEILDAASAMAARNGRTLSDEVADALKNRVAAQESIEARAA